MNAPASPLREQIHDYSLAELLGALAPHDDKKLVIEYAGRTIGAGYHVTEVKAGSFVTLDCGGNPDAWQETILQVEDLPPIEGQDFMRTDKFRSILAKVAQKVALDAGSRLTFEVGPPGAPMQVFDVDGLSIDARRAVLRLGARPAICKPRHRAEQAQTASCCGPRSAKANCCA
ncbi:hypothetical protein C3941_00440 [Kaistia algarum]|uniref:DUF6428 family protein n=1 Tax=Kaistia algarum TaxID=2083279 RepID=UPI000CE8D168|nr:DUF6428 family protein [Kaistia algarum]MCX5513314.1 DUF6428 family protein [Kaistia algarum]PPE81233.1 hypothetical protein C3941_00440 [Kaistia algarum]